MSNPNSGLVNSVLSVIKQWFAASRGELTNDQKRQVEKLLDELKNDTNRSHYHIQRQVESVKLIMERTNGQYVNQLKNIECELQNKIVYQRKEIERQKNEVNSLEKRVREMNDKQHEKDTFLYNKLDKMNEELNKLKWELEEKKKENMEKPEKGKGIDVERETRIGIKEITELLEKLGNKSSEVREELVQTKPPDTSFIFPINANNNHRMPFNPYGAAPSYGPPPQPIANYNGGPYNCNYRPWLNNALLPTPMPFNPHSGPNYRHPTYRPAQYNGENHGNNVLLPTLMSVNSYNGPNYGHNGPNDNRYHGPAQNRGNQPDIHVSHRHTSNSTNSSKRVGNNSAADPNKDSNAQLVILPTKQDNRKKNTFTRQHNENNNQPDCNRNVRKYNNLDKNNNNNSKRCNKEGQKKSPSNNNNNKSNKNNNKPRNRPNRRSRNVNKLQSTDDDENSDGSCFSAESDTTNASQRSSHHSSHSKTFYNSKATGSAKNSSDDQGMVKTVTYPTREEAYLKNLNIYEKLSKKLIAIGKDDTGQNVTLHPSTLSDLYKFEKQCTDIRVLEI